MLKYSAVCILVFSFVVLSGCATKAIDKEVYLDFKETKAASTQEKKELSNYVQSFIEMNGFHIYDCVLQKQANENHQWVCSYYISNEHRQSWGLPTYCASNGYDELVYGLRTYQYYNDKKLIKIMYYTRKEEIPDEVHKRAFFVMQNIEKKAKMIGFELKASEASNSKWIEDYSDW